MTEIELSIEQGRIALKGNEGAKAVQEALAGDYLPDVARTEAVPFPEVPKPVEITPEVADALTRLKEVFARVQPTERRPLTDTEKTEVHAEREVLKHIIGLLSKRDEDLKEIVRTHMDQDALERNVAVETAQVDVNSGVVIVEATDRDAKGHLILCAPGQPERTSIPGTNLEWSREYKKGSLTTDPSVLDTLHESGEISHDVYLAMTREKRVYDESKAYGVALDKPDLRDDILRATKAMLHRGKPTISLFTRKAK